MSSKDDTFAARSVKIALDIREQVTKWEIRSSFWSSAVEESKRVASGDILPPLCSGGCAAHSEGPHLPQHRPPAASDSRSDRSQPAARLAECFIKRKPGNLQAVTGTRRPAVIGALYPAG